MKFFVETGSIWGQGEEREHVKDCDGRWICKGMYVLDDGFRQGIITDVIDDRDGIGRIKVKVFKDSPWKELEHPYITDFEPGEDWCMARFDGI